MNLPSLRKSQNENHASRRLFDYRTKCLTKIHANLLSFTITYKTDFMLLNEPSDFSLWAKINIDRITLTFGGRDTNSHVLFLIRALYSLSMTIFQIGSQREDTKLRGRGDLNTDFRRLKDFLGLEIPCWLLITWPVGRLEWQIGEEELGGRVEGEDGLGLAGWGTPSWIHLLGWARWEHLR